MNSKKFFTVLLFAMFSVTVMPAFAGDPSPAITTEKTSTDAHAQQVLKRLDEIRNLDRSKLSTSEKKELRKELRKLKRESEPKRNGIYLSVGAIVVIGILLLLLL